MAAMSTVTPVTAPVQKIHTVTGNAVPGKLDRAGILALLRSKTQPTDNKPFVECVIEKINGKTCIVLPNAINLLSMRCGKFETQSGKSKIPSTATLVVKAKGEFDFAVTLPNGTVETKRVARGLNLNIFVPVTQEQTAVLFEQGESDGDREVPEEQ